MDLFATDLKARCRRFYTRWAAPGALGFNALNHDWSEENIWANPPFHLLGPVVHKIIADGATITLIAPVWRTQPWWSRAVEAAMDWHLLPLADGVHTHGSRSAPARPPHWRTAVFRCAPRRSPMTPRAGLTPSPAS